MVNEIKAIIFDVNGVLLQIKGKKFRDAFAHKLSTNSSIRFETISPKITNIIINDSQNSQFFKSLCRLLNLKEQTMKRILFKIYRTGFEENKQLLSVMEKLKSNYKLAILSDQISFSHQAIKKFNLDSYVHISVWSHEIGFRKPDTMAYKIMLEKLKIPAENCLFIDNQPWNLITAKKLGIKTILYKNNKQLFKQLLNLGIKI